MTCGNYRTEEQVHNIIHFKEIQIAIIPSAGGCCWMDIRENSAVFILMMLLYSGTLDVFVFIQGWATVDKDWSLVQQILSASQPTFLVLGKK